MLSSHKCEVVQINNILPHENSDNLEIAQIFNGGYNSVVSKGQYHTNDLIIFIPPDSLVDTRKPEFSFLASRAKGDNSYVRIHACKFKGVMSYGLIIPNIYNANIGDDMAEFLGVLHYEPQEEDKSYSVGAPNGVWTKYDIDNLRRYSSVFKNGDIVTVTEKVHGENCLATFVDNTLHVRSRTRWKANTPSSLFWQSVLKNPGIEKFCRDNPGYGVYGEEYGKVKGFNYGLLPNTVNFACFDIRSPDGRYLHTDKWLDICEKYDIPHVPIYRYNWQFDLEAAIALAEGPCEFSGANHVREGVVVRSHAESWDETIGRKILKIVGFGYLQKKQ